MSDTSQKPQPKVPDKVIVDNNVRKEPPVPVELIEPEKLKKNQNNIQIDTVKIDSEIKKSVKEREDLVDEKLIQETNEVYASLKKVKTKNDESQKQMIDSIPKENNKMNSGQKNNDVIAVDAIKKEELELAADKEMSNVESMQRREQLDKTLEKHIMQEKDLMEEQKQLLKDIEQKKKEIEQAKKIEMDQEKAKKVTSFETKIKSDGTNSINQDPINNMIINAEKNILKLTKEKSKESITKNEKSSGSLQNSQNLVPDNKTQSSLNFKSEKVIVKEKEPNYEKEKNGEPVLTKKSNIPPNEKERIDEQTKIKKDTNTVYLKNNQEKKPKDDSSVPIVLKMNNQTKVPDVEMIQKHESNANVTGMKRNMLELHPRKKREESGISDVFIDNSEKYHENNSNVDKTSLEEKICSKKSEKQVTLNSEINSNNLLKESKHLSDQIIEKKVPQASILEQNDHFINVNINKRDLKAINFNRDDRKK